MSVTQERALVSQLLTGAFSLPFCQWAKGLNLTDERQNSGTDNKFKVNWKSKPKQLRRIPNHGTVSRYSNNACRCDECRKAWSDHIREYNHRTGRRKPREQYLAELRAAIVVPEHGTAVRYNKPHSCRCDECRAASSAQKREWRKRTGKH